MTSRKSAEKFVPRALLTEAELYQLILARRRSGTRQKDLALQIGLSATALDNYESGRRCPPSFVLDKWRAALSAVKSRRSA